MNGEAPIAMEGATVAHVQIMRERIIDELRAIANPYLPDGSVDPRAVRGVRLVEHADGRTKVRYGLYSATQAPRLLARIGYPVVPTDRKEVELADATLERPGLGGV